MNIEDLQPTKIVVLTGAGMSTESGVPDFRSQRGLWSRYNPAKVASVDSLENHYELFSEFYRERMKALRTIEPHRGHRILAEWEEAGKLHAIATQNVDGLHQVAGNKNVLELHGSIRSTRCHQCERVQSEETFLRSTHCEHCQGVLRPNVVLFGEMLPELVWDEAVKKIEEADVLLVIGTSLQVSPVNQLPYVAKGKTVYINDEPSDFPFDFWINKTISSGLSDLKKKRGDRRYDVTFVFIVAFSYYVHRDENSSKHARRGRKKRFKLKVTIKIVHYYLLVICTNED
ncbi:NAD-dependent deacylase [Geomicrobium sp. JCM 19055]|uniref:SIR2 family NAD-dependent protein deacylase n=1 Tax=Geomicrobium sp. JCM 19055 TaxID=1460649 RepID=UPI00045ED2F3|nr:NAD-dependent deacylase [Geomicrobium sp. JCM 19055]GAJ98711.1 NAD-dependent protein deacetylase of SIR2 family [Geomicrobium sp. JCM 19055]